MIHLAINYISQIESKCSRFRVSSSPIRCIRLLTLFRSRG